MKINDPHDFRGGLNKDDSPSNLPPSDYTDALNVRTLASEEQHGAGILETLQGEIELLLGVSAPITYYGESIGGEFNYVGFEEVQIGTQVWMKKNYDAEYPGSKVYDDDEDNADIYGRLYNWHQVMSSDFCPAGWRVPTEADIDILIAELLGAAVAGGHMKEVGESHWNTPNLGADDSGGFRALPGGKFDTLFELLGDNCLLWLQDEVSDFYPLMDLDGNIYTSVIIGSQEWIVENLKTTKYADGSAIPQIHTNFAWQADTEGAFAWYNDDVANEPDYGLIYNTIAVDHETMGVKDLAYLEKNGVQDIGWRIPTKTDWETLSTFLGGDGVSGGLLKEMGIVYWNNPNTGAVNTSGFYARGGGYWSDAGSTGFKNYGMFATSTDAGGGAWNLVYLDKDSDNLTHWANDIKTGVSVRLVRDI
jgi:uncharacterized protein (TIGR02145 family)